MTTRLLFLLCSLVLTSAIAAEPVAVIFDTDMDSDCDDVGALAMLHALADKGEARILVAGVSSKHEWSAPCVDAINTFYGRPDIPIGAPKGNAPSSGSKYARKLAEQFPHKLKSGNDAPDVIELYRDVLIKQPDQSVVLITVGDLTNVAALLKLPASEGKPAGLELARTKIKLWACMGGNFIGKPAHDDLKLSNNNFTSDKAASVYAVTNWPSQLMFVGREIGSVPSGLKVGLRLKELPENNPVRAGYTFYFDGTIKDRHVADQTTILYAVRGREGRWDAEMKGYMALHPDNTFDWKYDADKNQGYLLKLSTDTAAHDRKIEKEIEELMMHQPKAR